MKTSELLSNRISARLMRVAVLAGVLAQGGCSTLTDLSGVPKPGIQSDGHYALGVEQRTLPCREMQSRVVGLRERQQLLSKKAVDEAQQLPPTLAAAWGRIVGSPDGTPALVEYNEADAERVALQRAMDEKGCASPIETAGIKR